VSRRAIVLGAGIAIAIWLSVVLICVASQAAYR
jgi:hypothetical protein